MSKYRTGWIQVTALASDLGEESLSVLAAKVKATRFEHEAFKTNETLGVLVENLQTLSATAREGFVNVMEAHGIIGSQVWQI